MNLDLEVQLAGEYELSIFNPETGKTRTRKFKNLITDVGLDNFVNGLPTYVGLGSGSTTPANSDTALASQYARAGTMAYGGNNFTDVRIALTGSYTFAQGAAAGNLSEIGMFYAASGGAMFSRSLVKDGSGNPTTITILPIEIVTVQYTISLYWPAADFVQTITIDGVSTVCTTRPRDTTNLGNSHNPSWSATFNPYGNGAQGPEFFAYPATLSARTATNGPTAGSSSGQLSAGGDQAYVAGTYRRACVYGLTISQANLTGGIGGVNWQTGFGRYQTVFDHPVQKDNTKTASFQLYISWGRYAP